MIEEKNKMKYLPALDSVRTHTVPKWFEDCKLGIFIHWGAYSVPAYAPPTVELGEMPIAEEWFSNNPYSEWYLNSLRIGKGPTYEHHMTKYGKDFPYENFADMWKAEKWDPTAWAKLFKDAGAKYVIPVTKHHDGLCLWPSRYTDYHTGNKGPQRDIVGELGEAVREADMKYGLYYSGILDWRYTYDAITDMYDLRNPMNITNAYADYALNQAMELIEKYKPSVLWNDIGWPKKGLGDLPTLFAHYYNTVPEGVVNDRWSDVWCDFTTKEYQHGVMTLDKKWELCRGLGLSFAYNQEENETHYIEPRKLVTLLIESVSHNGNFLINVGPKADGTIPEEQRVRLEYLGTWMKENGEAIYGTRPYERQQERLAKGVTVFFTRKGNDLYLFLDDCPAGETEVLVPGLGAAAPHMKMLSKAEGVFSKQDDDLLVRLSGVPEKAPACVICAKEVL